MFLLSKFFNIVCCFIIYNNANKLVFFKIYKKKILIYSLQAPLIFITVVFILTLFVVSINDLFTTSFADDINKRSPYECGFQPFDSNIQQFEIKYYVVALLFLIFDVETLFLIPYVSVINYSNLYIFYNIFFFLLVLFLGLFYEWKNNFLDWE